MGTHSDQLTTDQPTDDDSLTHPHTELCERATDYWGLTVTE